MRTGLITVLLSLAFAGCAHQPRAVQFLAFGDGGYHYDYLDADDAAGFPTQDAFVANERIEWLKDKRPAGEFRPAPAFRRSGTDSWIEASGQAAVADAMRHYCEGTPACEFAVMLGDNIYPDGATAGADDAERFRKILHEPYAPLAALAEEFRIYVALGNHDWRTSREGAMAQVRYHETTRPFYMDGIRYKVAPTGDPRELEVFVLDTHVMLSAYPIPDDELADDGSEVDSHRIDETQAWAVPRTEDERRMAEWLEQELARSPARWKIVIGHHPLWSSAGSKFQQARMLRRLILPALCRHADLYFAGHEHTLELHTDDCKGIPEARGRPPLAEVVSGAAAKQRPLNTAFARRQIEASPQLTSIWARGLTWGFVHVTLEPDQATIRMVTTPDNGSGLPEAAFEHRFDRRSGR